MGKFQHSDDIPVAPEVWEGRIETRLADVREARAEGDSAGEALAEDRLNRALDNYARDSR